jgi:hypothetical protein
MGGGRAIPTLISTLAIAGIGTAVTNAKSNGTKNNFFICCLLYNQNNLTQSRKERKVNQLLGGYFFYKWLSFFATFAPLRENWLFFHVLSLFFQKAFDIITNVNALFDATFASKTVFAIVLMSRMRARPVVNSIEFP